MLDGRAGLNPADREVLDLVREVGRPTVVAVNKLDQASLDSQAAEFYALGFERLFCISSAHGRGVEEMLDVIIAMLPERNAERSAPPDLRVALIGRPNVGKSSLLNRLVGFERAIVDEVAGTTRDPVDVRIDSDGNQLMLIDTAGIRRRTRVEGELEHHSVGRAIATIRRAEVLILVVDSTEGVTDQDARLARLVFSEDRAMVLVCNKWDEAARAGRRVTAFRRDLAERFPFLENDPTPF